MPCKAVAVDVKTSSLRAGDTLSLCAEPCKTRLLVFDAHWEPRGWGVSRYTSLMAVEPVLGAAGGTTLACPGGTSHCYKLEVAGYMGFWGRGAETLAAHIEECGASLVCTPRGPWLEAYRVYITRANVVEEDGLGLGYCYCGDPLHNPMFHEGGATLAYELYEQGGEWDAVVVPGYPPLLESLRVGYERLSQLGLIEEPPRIYAVDVGVGIPRWLVDKLEAVEVRPPRGLLDSARRSLREARLPSTRDSILAEAARLALLAEGELGREERVAIILL